MPDVNNEGFTLAPQAECVDGLKPAIWSDDNDTDGHALRQGTVRCTVALAPTIAASVSGAPNDAGWYDAPVTVSFTCTAGSAPLVAPCPDPVVVRDGADQVVTGEVAATDGESASVQAGPFSVDTAAPEVRVAGVRAGAVYRGAEPSPECSATDALSGVVSCTLTTTRAVQQVTLTAVAVDVAGNTSTTVVRYRVPLVQVVGARYVGGRYVVRRGQAFKVQALIAESARPRLLAPRRQHEALTWSGKPMRALRTQDGVTTFVATRAARRTQSGARWKIGVRDGADVIVVRLLVR